MVNLDLLFKSKYTLHLKTKKQITGIYFDIILLDKKDFNNTPISSSCRMRFENKMKTF